jgi:2'-5' RNA ligase
VRLFVAAELPRPVAEALVAWAPAHEALRPVPLESLHVTLAFLGERSAVEASAVGRLLAGLARPVGGLSLGAALWLPPRRPGVLAVAVSDPSGALTGLQADLAAALRGAIGLEPERRRFLAHVTVARVRRRRDPSALPAPPGVPAFAATAVTLFESRSSSQGARYLALDRARL